MTLAETNNTTQEEPGMEREEGKKTLDEIPGVLDAFQNWLEQFDEGDLN